MPKATIVNPITVVDIPKFFAKDEAPSTKKSAHFISRMNPAMDNDIFITMYSNTSLVMVC